MTTSGRLNLCCFSVYLKVDVLSGERVRACARERVCASVCKEKVTDSALMLTGVLALTSMGPRLHSPVGVFATNLGAPCFQHPILLTYPGAISNGVSWVRFLPCYSGSFPPAALLCLLSTHGLYFHTVLSLRVVNKPTILWGTDSAPRMASRQLAYCEFTHANHSHDP